MWYQRIEEIVHPNSQPRAAPPRLPKTGEGFPQKVMQKRKLETSIAEDTVSCFKRVRLLQHKYDREVELDAADWDDTYSVRGSEDAESDDADWDEADLRQEIARIRNENEELRREAESQASRTAWQLQELQILRAYRHKSAFLGYFA
jgi:hypothetical protein